MSNVQDRIARTRRFFELDSWSLEAPDAWQHILTGACDDNDMYGDKSFNALDMGSMFSEYRVFGIACNDAFHYLIERMDAIFRVAGFVADDVRLALYEMPRPDDYTAADILTKVSTYTRIYIENKIEKDTQKEYCLVDLDQKKRTEADYWQVIKMVLGEIEVIAK